MPRRFRPEKRTPPPDQKYNSVNIAMVINRVMKDGKKSTAERIVYNALDLIEKRTKSNPVEVFENALSGVRPRVEVKARRVGGSTYQIPLEVDARRQLTLSMRWIIAAARKRSGRTMAEKLANELMDAAKGQGAAVKKRDDTHRMAEANRAFAHFGRR